MKSSAIMERVSTVALYAIAAFLPVWFLPVTQDVLVYQKQTILLLLALLGVAAWVGRVMYQGSMQFRLSLLHIPVVLLIGAAGISTLFSSWSYASFWGLPLHIADNFVTLFAFGLVYFLVSQGVRDSKQAFQLLCVFLVSSAVACVFAITQAYGMFALPFDFAKSITFNTIGTTNAVAVFAALLVPMAIAFSFVAKVVLRFALWAIVAFLVLVLAILNFATAWVCLIAGLLALLAFGMWNLRKRAEFGWISLPMALIILAVFFMVFPVRVPMSPRNLPAEVSLSQKATWNIATEALQGSALFGSGPGMFGAEYLLHRPAELNQTAFFGTKFFAGASEALDWLITKGAVGLALLFLAAGLAMFSAIRSLVRPAQDSFAWMTLAGVFASFFAVIVSFFFYPASFLVFSLFWILLGSIAMLSAKEYKKFSAGSHSLFALGSSFSFLLLVIFGLGLLFMAGQKYIAEVYYVQGVRLSGQGNLDGAIGKVLGAAQANPSLDMYWRSLAQLYLAQINSINGSQGLTQEEKSQKIQAAVSRAIVAAKTATDVAPGNADNWTVRASVYKNLAGAEGASAFAAEFYSKAAELDPRSPLPWTELARTYVLVAQNLRNQTGQEDRRVEALENALSNLQKAIDLKSDYSSAHYLLAVVYDQQGKIDEAISKLEETKKIAPNDIGLGFQLGVAYWRNEDVEKARVEFERIKALNPNYSNARYMLGLAYDAQGNKEKARGEFQAVSVANPDNEEVRKILENLDNNLPALQGVAAQDLPVEE